MKKILIILAIILVSVLAILVLKDQAIKLVVTVTATQVTGAPTHIDGFSLGIFNRSIKITGLRMYNPRGFSRGILVDLSKIYVKYDLGDLIKGKLHLTNAEIELKELGIEKNKDGNLNADSLKVVKEGRKSSKEPAKQMPMQIDLLKLGIGKVIFKDFSQGNEPAVNVYDVNIHKDYKNITSVQQLASLILAEPMKAAGIQGAKIYGVSMIAGVAVLPVALAATFAGKDSAQQVFSRSFEDVYSGSLSVLKKMGKVTREDRRGGSMAAEVNSAQINLKVSKNSAGKIEVHVSARKFMFPKPEIAAGVLYEISGKLK